MTINLQVNELVEALDVIALNSFEFTHARDWQTVAETYSKNEFIQAALMSNCNTLRALLENEIDTPCNNIDRNCESHPIDHRSSAINYWMDQFNTAQATLNRELCQLAWDAQGCSHI